MASPADPAPEATLASSVRGVSTGFVVVVAIVVLVVYLPPDEGSGE